MSKYIYPAEFHPGDPDESGYTVTFPDLPGCISEGNSLEESLSMARDALGGHLYLLEEDQDPIPTPTKPEDIKVSPGGFATLVQANTDFIRERMRNKSVNKTITLPKWLNDVATEEGINFSQTLQDALKYKLDSYDSA